MSVITNEKKIIGIDLFSGAGGLSLGAEMAGVEVLFAVENDPYAARTYKINHPKTKVICEDIRKIDKLPFYNSNGSLILFGGPPCQGFSTSNQKTRNKENAKNWLFQEFIRIANQLEPDWIVFENVKGIVETEKGYFIKELTGELEQLGYTCTSMVLCASDYGIPQIRSRFFLIGSKKGIKPKLPEPITTKVSVRDAIEDLPSLPNGASQDVLPYPLEAKSDYAIRLRNGGTSCSGNLVTKNSEIIIKRYNHIPQGGNWEDIPDELMKNYTDKSRCHTGIYRRLSAGDPSVTVGNYRKSMLVHPWENRGLSVREAARLQSFPDSYRFYGMLGHQQQQVGNAVPPMLAKIVFEMITTIQ
ncbi:MAG: DNA cytosine methyltransferase [Clostridiales bacterium]|nr:DNA cytosine methyltransferase [Clostridiales bacterium]